MLRFSGVGVTDVGNVRDHNEDSGFLGPYAALVADGVGGAAAGEVASATAAYVVAAVARQRQGEDPASVLTEGIQLAVQSLSDGVAADLARAGMATTMTAVVTDGERVVMAHIGDSRGYLFRDGRLMRVSSDHTYVQQLVDQGHLDPDAVRRHPWRNVVLRSLHGQDGMGQDGMGQEHADLVELGLVVGDRVLLCSDGLTDLVPEHRIAEVLHLQDSHRAAARLVEDALEAGGSDNVTCLVFDVVNGPEVSGDGQLIGALRDVHNIVDPAAVTSPGRGTSA
jgi:serine/threonine protein phosphatase PrpC